MSHQNVIRNQELERKFDIYKFVNLMDCHAIKMKYEICIYVL